MRWKENNIDAFLDAEGNEIGRDMTVMTIANEKAIFIRGLKFISCDQFKMFDPLHAVIIVGPSFRIACKHPTAWKMLWEPIGHQVFAFENDIWRNQFTGC